MLRSRRGREEKLMQRQARWRCGGAVLVLIEHGLVSGGWAVMMVVMMIAAPWW